MSMNAGIIGLLEELTLKENIMNNQKYIGDEETGRKTVHLLTGR